jgi:hypothetical protein
MLTVDLIRCIACRSDWEVTEIPVGNATWKVDPNRYRCPRCRKPTLKQLGLEQARDTLEYDPDMVELPL